MASKKNSNDMNDSSRNKHDGQELLLYLLDAVDKGLNLARMQRGKRNYAGEGMKRLSWENYGARYSEKLIRIR